ncbi:uncharacterized protein ARB_04039 [Trichophyton benhamiae CBS 112371]|uniref:Aminoglycoside phosphotransferase domain-containing protein n=2 Tax=Trichophyton TaxID=5550 RepID=D4AIE5_ARTBC|nr:uncharacterized protein ARB_04039 [Trichophyton benhamiae CBS 112371]EFE36518.1 hypothetical protein ARB_04039 [Trichophyton benhamiae CBS 112371]
MEYFIDSICWGRVIEKCYYLRQGVYCFLSEVHTSGETSHIRKITFEDGVQWVIRLRLPNPTTGEEDIGVRTCYESLKYLRDETTVPVPEAYYCDASLSNAIGAPYILMDYIHGTTAEKLRKNLGYRENEFGSVDENINFKRGLAMIQVELASKKFNRIGRPRPAPQGGYYVASTPTEAAHDTSGAFYRRLTSNLLREARMSGRTVAQDLTLSIPALFEQLIARWSTHRGPFGVALTSLGAHNVLVDENFRVQAVIHPEGLMAVPREIQAQMPLSMGLQTSPPRSRAESVAQMTTLMEEMERAKSYVSYLKEADRIKYAGVRRDADDAPLYTAVLGPAALIYQGLVEFKNFRENVDRRWLTARDLFVPGQMYFLSSSIIFKDTVDEI